MKPTANLLVALALLLAGTTAMAAQPATSGDDRPTTVPPATVPPSTVPPAAAPPATVPPATVPPAAAPPAAAPPTAAVPTAATIAVAADDAAAEPAPAPEAEAEAGPAPAAVDYLRQIKPLLAARCYACHGALKQESGLRLDTVATARSGGDSGPAIVAGDSAASPLMVRVAAVDEWERMPPEGEPLTADQQALIAKWIDQGAAAPPDEQPEPDPRDHWSFRALARPPLPAAPPVAAEVRQTVAPDVLPAVPPPALQRDEPQHPIDAFIAARQAEHGLVPRGPAPREMLLRRVSLDLTGLPPTRDELAAFVADDAPDAYERVVERLLASPQYGERWGRHWMDVWRYSDWYGRRAVPDWWNSASQIWRWRDWIIDSLNDDLGYDRMVALMLAADEIAPEDDTAIVATGYLARNWYALNYNFWMKDIVEHTGKAFLGLTFNCAQCHDHKYDPISQREYFAFRAVFEPLEMRQDRVAGEVDPGPFQKYEYTALRPPVRSGLIRVFDERPEAPTLMYSGGDERNTIPGLPPVAPAGPAFLDGHTLTIATVELPPAAYYPGLKAFVQDEERSARIAALDEAAAQLEAARGQVAALLRSGGDSVAGQDATAHEETLDRDAAAATDEAAVCDAAALSGQDIPDELAAAHGAALWAARVAEARLAAAEAELASFDARVSADRARYLESSAEAESLARAAVDGERRAALAAAVHQRTLAEQALEAAQRELAGLVASLRAPAAPDDSAVAAADRVAAHDASANNEARVLAGTAATAGDSGDAAAPGEVDERQVQARAAVESAQQVLTAAIDAAQAAEAACAADTSADYTPLSPQYAATSTGRRRALAEWMTSRENPLTPRVAVNHIWMRHFGRPLVESVFDFGRNGQLPSHPELLDWLAIELIEHGGSMKHLHRLIVTSRTYRQDSRAAADDPAHGVDPDNRYLWRYNARRLEAEVLRDSLLWASGSLDLTLGGPDIDNLEAEAVPRRSLYFTVHPEAGGNAAMLSLFDAPDPTECYRRAESIVPQQALALANSRASLDSARRLARRLESQLAGDDGCANVDESAPDCDDGCADVDESFIRAAFEQLLTRGPTAVERAACGEFLARQRALYEQTWPAAESSESPGADAAAPVPVGTTPPAARAAARARESLVHVLLNHHEFVTLP